MSWFVRNVREMKWWTGRSGGFISDLVNDDDAQVGVNLFVLDPGDPMSMYHWETDQEGFLVLSGEALLIVDDEEKVLRQWDYFHCPIGVPHTIVGGGSGPCTILAIGARLDSVTENWGAYPYSEVAMKYNASAEAETKTGDVAYARFPPATEAAFQERWLP